MGSRVALTMTYERTDGRYEHVVVKELPALTVLFLQPGRIFPATRKVTFPATVETAVIAFAWRKIKLPGARVRDALTELLEIVIVVAVEVSAK